MRMQTLGYGAPDSFSRTFPSRPLVEFQEYVRVSSCENSGREILGKFTGSELVTSKQKPNHRQVLFAVLCGKQTSEKMFGPNFLDIFESLCLKTAYVK